MSDTHPSPLIFGIYPGGHTGIEELAVTSDDPLRIHEALNRLQVDDLPFLVRGYLPYIYQPPSADWTRCVLQANSDASCASSHAWEMHLVEKQSMKTKEIM